MECVVSSVLSLEVQIALKIRLSELSAHPGSLICFFELEALSSAGHYILMIPVPFPAMNKDLPTAKAWTCDF